MLDYRLRCTMGKRQAQPLARCKLLRRTHDLAAGFRNNAVAALEHSLWIEVVKIRPHFPQSRPLLFEQARLSMLQAQTQIPLPGEVRIDIGQSIAQSLGEHGYIPLSGIQRMTRRRAHSVGEMSHVA